MEFGHDCLMRQDEQLQDLERKHLAALHQLQRELLEKQHQAELANQSDCTLRAERYLRQRHLVENKQMPKYLKVCGVLVIKKIRNEQILYDRQFASSISYLVTYMYALCFVQMGFSI